MTCMLSGLSLAADISGQSMAEFLTSYQNGLTVQQLVTDTASTIYQALVELGPGICLLDNEVTMIAESLTEIPDM